jgi:hypothetical protein
VQALDFRTGQSFGEEQSVIASTVSLWGRGGLWISNVPFQVDMTTRILQSGFSDLAFTSRTEISRAEAQSPAPVVHTIGNAGGSGTERQVSFPDF